MKIQSQQITVRELTAGYTDDSEDGVRGYSGKLDIRPPYQRAFVYKDKQRAAVIDTVLKGFPLNVMYWAAREDGEFEVIDGQQRTVSICQYVAGDCFVDVDGHMHSFNTLPPDKKNAILDYVLTVYVCSGEAGEKLKWFETINIAGEKLTDQELRNAVYAGPWVTDAKRYFSRTNCAADGLAGKYLTGSPIRQDYLETVIKWACSASQTTKPSKAIEAYMVAHQHKPAANDLWLYFQSVMAWVKSTFPNYRSEMKGLAWGDLYNEFKDVELDPISLDAEVSRLMEDEDVTSKKGIYQYVLDKDERHLNIRTFSKTQKRTAYEKQAGICPACNNHFAFEGMEGDHITPWHLGGKTVAENCKMLCKDCNRQKGGK